MKKLTVLVTLFIILTTHQVKAQENDSQFDIELMQQIEVHSSGFSWSPQGNYFVTLEFDGEVSQYEIWSTKNLALVWTITPEVRGQPNYLRWNPNEQFLAILGYLSNEIEIWDVRQQTKMATSSITLTSGSWFADFDWYDNTIIAITSKNMETSIVFYDVYDIKEPALAHTITHNVDDLWLIQWSPTGQTFATMTQHGDLQIWNPKTYEAISFLHSSSNILDTPLIMFTWKPDGSSILGASKALAAGSQIWEWNLEPNNLAPPFSESVATPYSLQWSNDGRFILAGINTETNYIHYVLNASTKNIIFELAKFGSQTQVAVAWHPKEDILAVNDGQNLYFYEVVETSS